MHTEKRYKRGDVREDGMVFWTYDRSLKVPERWYSAKDFEVKYRNYQQKAKEHYLKNRERILANVKEWTSKNHERKLKYILEHQKKNAVQVRARKRAWEAKNKDRLSEQRRLKLQSDLLLSLRMRVRRRLQVALQRASYRKSKGTADIIGCTMQELCVHLEQKFLPGMSWEGRSLWHIDHIVPIAAARTEEEIYLLSHYTNLRPLWGHENISKGDRLPDELPSTIHPEVRAIWLREKQHTNP